MKWMLSQSKTIIDDKLDDYEKNHKFTAVKRTSFLIIEQPADSQILLSAQPDLIVFWNSTLFIFFIVVIKRQNSKRLQFRKQHEK